MNENMKAFFREALCLILALTFVFPAPLLAQESDEEPDPPKILELKKDDLAPFDGVFLNSSAAAQMLANQNFLEAECKLKIDFELAKLQARHDLLVNNLQINLATTKIKYDSILSIKDAEIGRLSEIALENSNDYSHWWAAGGFLVGSLIALGIFFASAEASK